MRISEAFAFLFLLLFAAFPCRAQVMDPSEYRGVLKHLDASLVEWRQQLETFDIEHLDVNFSLGKSLERQKQIGLRNVALMHDVIGRQLTKDILSGDVTVEESLADLNNMLSDTVSIIPDNEQAMRWARGVPSIVKEVASYQSDLRRHILAYADHLQKKAAKCSVQ